MSDTPENIYLIHGEYEGERCRVWCDDPAPSAYSDPAEAVKYVRADTLPVVTDNGKVNVGLIAEIERLQARVAELESFINQAPVETGVCMCGEEMYRHSSQPNHTPMDSWDYERDLILRNDAGKAEGADNAG